jgi:hypothetical protein
MASIPHPLPLDLDNGISNDNTDINKPIEKPS